MQRDRSNGPDDLDDPVVADPADAGGPDRARSVEEAELLTDAALQPDDPIEGEAARRGADPDLAGGGDRGEEP